MKNSTRNVNSSIYRLHCQEMMQSTIYVCSTTVDPRSKIGPECLIGFERLRANVLLIVSSRSIKTNTYIVKQDKII